MIAENLHTTKISLFAVLYMQLSAHVLWGTLFTLASKLLDRGQECFGWIELHGKTLPVPRTNIIACLLVGAVATCGHLLDAASGICSSMSMYYEFRPQHWFGICRTGKCLRHSCTHCTSSHACMHMRVCSTCCHFLFIEERYSCM